MKPQLILIAGPYRGGTDGDVELARKLAIPVYYQLDDVPCRGATPHDGHAHT
ncbi:hypothetical protein [Paraburkholderia sp. J12]|uniref:hypothetical protein n=1 Tax=Paraburkholderia sp. J12 TaxID=2805432 RepID=UPI002ABD1808|nr:hypothetical protein [Paraburkholderia sp. J12]